MAAETSEAFFVFRKALAHTTLQTLLQQGSRSRSFELLSLKRTLGAALRVSLEPKAANVRLRRQASNGIHPKALLAARGLAEISDACELSIVVKVEPKNVVASRMPASTPRGQRNLYMKQN